jgi:SAM-dependent methyltransferase
MDLDIAIVGDLHSVALKASSYDVIYNANVIEHIDGAEAVLTNFANWLKPGGILILRFPNRDSVVGFLTRVTPFWVHVFYKKYFQGMKNAGKPGYDPYPTFFDEVVSRKGIRRFCEEQGLIIKAEYRFDIRPIGSIRLWRLVTLFMWVLHFLSFRRLSVDHRGLVYIIEKPLD